MKRFVTVNVFSGNTRWHVQMHAIFLMKLWPVVGQLTKQDPPHINLTPLSDSRLVWYQQCLEVYSLYIR